MYSVVFMLLLCLLHMSRHKALLCMPTVEVCLMHYGRHSKMENTLTSLVPINCWKMHWSVIAIELECPHTRYGRLLATASCESYDFMESQCTEK